MKMNTVFNDLYELSEVPVVRADLSAMTVSELHAPLLLVAGTSHGKICRGTGILHILLRMSDSLETLTPQGGRQKRASEDWLFLATYNNELDKHVWA